MKVLPAKYQLNRRWLPHLGFILPSVLILFFVSCINGTDTGVINPDIPENGVHQKLSDFRLFKGDLKELEPVEPLLPYDLNTQLFSDYSHKFRLVYVPGNQQITFRDEENLQFPVGSVLVKNFFYYHDLQDKNKGRRIIETRLLIHREEGWVGETYIWNDEQTDAFRHRTGSTKEVSWLDNKGEQQIINYVIPSVNDCRTCHSNNQKIEPLGPTVSNLNKQYDYQNGEENQLFKWMETDILAGGIDFSVISKFPDWNDPSAGTAERRARAYLDMNCASCHHAAGSASNTALFLEFDQDDPFHLGVCKIPVSAGTGSGGLKYNVVPGSPDESILLHRMKSVKPEVRMPELGRTVVHKEGVELIRQWIEELDLPGCK
jgi:uncharacterized repeat protein (TIGR03806 family)